MSQPLTIVNPSSVIMLYPISVKGLNLQTDVVDTLATRSFVALYKVFAANALVASATGILSATALTASTQNITAGITQPGVPKAVSITGNASGITGNVTVSGTSFDGTAITETIALNGTATVNGAKAFRAVSNVALPIQTHAGTDTVSVGFTEILGLPYKLARNTVLKTYLGQTLEGTAPTVTVSSTAIESNTFDLNSTLNSSEVDIYLMVD